MYRIPDKFIFRSHINTCTRGTIYHAMRVGNRYNITIQDEEFVWHSSIPEMRKMITSGAYEIVSNESEVLP